MKKESNLSIRLKEIVLAGAVRLAFGVSPKKLDFLVETVHTDPRDYIIKVYANGKLRGSLYMECEGSKEVFCLPHFRIMKWNRPVWEGTSHPQP